MSGPGQFRSNPADGGALPAKPADRLRGPEAGWENLHRNLAADAAVAEAELYAAGNRRLSVTHDTDHGTDHEMAVQVLVDAVDQVARDTGYSGGGTFTNRPGRTIWTWPSTDVPAGAVVRAAADQARRLNPGHWTIDADDH